MRLPIERSSLCQDSSGRLYRWEISVRAMPANVLYPEGVKAVFRLIKFELNQRGTDQIVLLIDNHAPYGFHEHDLLPQNHHSRRKLRVETWQEALAYFQERCKEILK
jgi:hypothetical protein